MTGELGDPCPEGNPRATETVHTTRKVVVRDGTEDTCSGPTPTTGGGGEEGEVRDLPEGSKYGLLLYGLLLGRGFVPGATVDVSDFSRRERGAGEGVGEGRGHCDPRRGVAWVFSGGSDGSGQHSPSPVLRAAGPKDLRVRGFSSTLSQTFCFSPVSS